MVAVVAPVEDGDSLAFPLVEQVGAVESGKMLDRTAPSPEEMTFPTSPALPDQHQTSGTAAPTGVVDHKDECPLSVVFQFGSGNSCPREKFGDLFIPVIEITILKKFS